MINTKIKATAFFLSVCAICLGGCSNIPGNDYCLIYEPISSYSVIKDKAPDVYLQIKQNNRIYTELCE